MEILLSRNYEINNLITRSGRFSSIEFPQIVDDLINEYKEYAINNGELIISTTKSIEIIDQMQILDVEVLLPVLYKLPVKTPYSYKSSIKLYNALYAKINDISKLQDAILETNQYIVKNNYQPITSAYLIQSKQNNNPCVEIYIGLNPNII